MSASLALHRLCPNLTAYRCNVKDFDVNLEHNWREANCTDIVHTQQCLLISKGSVGASSHWLMCNIALSESCPFVTAT